MPDNYVVRRLYRLKSGLTAFANVIYKNFGYIASVQELNHNQEEIIRILKSEQMIGVTIYYNKKMVGYIIGEATILQDGRLVYFVNYLYIADTHRGKGLGSYLLNEAARYIATFGLRTIVLLADISKQSVSQFYTKNGFEPDSHLVGSIVGTHTPLVKHLYYP